MRLRRAGSAVVAPDPIAAKRVDVWRLACWLGPVRAVGCFFAVGLHVEFPRKGLAPRDTYTMLSYAVRSIFKFAYGYPAAMVGGMAVLATRSPTLGLAFGAGTWTLAYIFVRREVRADDERL